jgi:hypothetical protein
MKSIKLQLSRVGFKKLENKDVIILGTIFARLHVHCTCTITSMFMVASTGWERSLNYPPEFVSKFGL